MPCIWCKKAAILPNSESWGLSQGVCEDCFKRARDGASGDNDSKTVPSPLMDDYARIFLLFDRDPETVKACLRRLADELGNLEGREGYRSSTPGRGHLKLSAALERYEAYCWFPPCGDSFVAQLSSDRFLNYLTRGLMAKDPGAGPKHGDFTHRIHWHVVCRVVTDQFRTAVRDGWNHSPLKLFTYLGEGPAVQAELWANLFEKGDSFRFPDKLNAHICGGDYGVLSINMRRRFEKRTRELEPHLRQVERPNDIETRTVGDRQVSRQRKAWSYLDSIGSANAAYAGRVIAKYQPANPGDPVLPRRVVDAGADIGYRITQSAIELNKDSLGAGGTLSYQNKLGAVRLQDLAAFGRRHNMRQGPGPH